MAEIWWVMPVGGYLVGAIPFGLIICKAFTQVDPRQGGSGNIGATNVARMAGKPAGITTLLLDAAKGALPVYLAGEWLLLPWQVAVVGLCAFLGHIWPVYMRFKGGKGVATALGVYLALSPTILAGVLLVFIVAVLGSGYVSLGSMLGCGSAPLWSVAIGAPGSWLATSLLMAGVVVWRHRANIVRLREGREHGLKKRG